MFRRTRARRERRPPGHGAREREIQAAVATIALAGLVGEGDGARRRETDVELRVPVQRGTQVRRVGSEQRDGHEPHREADEGAMQRARSLRQRRSNCNVALRGPRAPRGDAQELFTVFRAQNPGDAPCRVARTQVARGRKPWPPPIPV